MYLEAAGKAVEDQRRGSEKAVGDQGEAAKRPRKIMERQRRTSSSRGRTGRSPSGRPRPRPASPPGRKVGLHSAHTTHPGWQGKGKGKDKDKDKDKNKNKNSRTAEQGQGQEEDLHQHHWHTPGRHHCPAARPPAPQRRLRAAQAPARPPPGDPPHQDMHALSFCIRAVYELALSVYELALGVCIRAGLTKRCLRDGLTRARTVSSSSASCRTAASPATRATRTGSPVSLDTAHGTHG